MKTRAKPYRKTLRIINNHGSAIGNTYNSRMVYMYNENKELIRTFDSLKECNQFMGKSPKNRGFVKNNKIHDGFYFSYYNPPIDKLIAF